MFLVLNEPVTNIQIYFPKRAIYFPNHSSGVIKEITRIAFDSFPRPLCLSIQS